MSHRDVAAVVLWMAGALLAFSTTALSIRALSRSLGLFDILALRNVAGLVVLLGCTLLRPALRAELKPRRPGLHAARNVVHFASSYAWAVGVTLLPLATAFALEFTTPAWVALLAVPPLGERMTGSRAVSIGCGFLGVVVILRPGAAALQPASLIMLACAVGFAVVTIATKALTATESTFAILFWMNAIQLPLNLLGSAPASWTGLQAWQLWPLLGICVSGLASHFCLTNAYRHGDAIMVIPLDFLRIPLIAVIGWRFYGESLDPLVFAGAVLIIAGIVWNLRAEAAPAAPRAAAGG